MPSFDIVSEIDPHELQNAMDQASRELGQRFDFKDTKAELKKDDKGILLVANSEERVKAAFEVLQDKLLKRKLSLKFIESKLPEAAGGNLWRLQVLIKKGIEKEQAKDISQIVREDKTLKVTPSIQGELVRITGKKKDDLQAAIALLKSKNFPIELSFTNFRD